MQVCCQKLFYLRTDFRIFLPDRSSRCNKLYLFSFTLLTWDEPIQGNCGKGWIVLIRHDEGSGLFVKTTISETYNNLWCPIFRSVEKYEKSSKSFWWEFLFEFSLLLSKSRKNIQKFDKVIEQLYKVSFYRWIFHQSV